MRSYLRGKIDVIRPVISVFIIGFLGILVPQTRELFLELSFFVLLAGFFFLALFDNNGRKGGAFFLFVILFTFLLEFVGVKTGEVFGTYAYGKNLGPKILDTPIIIGVNWAIVSYSSSALARYLNSKVAPLQKGFIGRFFLIFTSSVLMVMMDFILEKIAPLADFWSWEDGIVPLRNYIAWFITALLINSGIEFFNIDTRNKAAIPLFVSMVLFLSIIYLILIISN